MFTERGQGLIRWGTVLLFLSVVSGFAIPLVSDPVLGLAAHIQGVLNAILILIVGLIWSRVELGYLASATVYWGLIIPGFVTLFVMWLCTFTGIGATAFPVVDPSFRGSPSQEWWVSTTMRSMVAITTVTVTLLTYGVLKKPAV